MSLDHIPSTSVIEFTIYYTYLAFNTTYWPWIHANGCFCVCLCVCVCWLVCLLVCLFVSLPTRLQKVKLVQGFKVRPSSHKHQIKCFANSHTSSGRYTLQWQYICTTAYTCMMRSMPKAVTGSDIPQHPQHASHSHLLAFWLQVRIFWHPTSQDIACMNQLIYILCSRLVRRSSSRACLEPFFTGETSKRLQLLITEDNAEKLLAQCCFELALLGNKQILL